MREDIVLILRFIVNNENAMDASGSKKSNSTRDMILLENGYGRSTNLAY